VIAGEPKTSFRPRMAAAVAGARPAAGLLYGHRYHDDDGGYTLVDGFVPAESAGLVPIESDPAAARARLRAEAARSYPGSTEVGWWRTAPRPGDDGWPDAGAWPLSERPEGMGLVVFADGTPPAAASPAHHTVVQGTVLDDQLTTASARREPAPEPEPEPAQLTSLQPAQPVASNGRPTRGMTGPPVQSPLLVQQDELRSRRRLEHERGGILELEPQQWVLLAMVVLVLVIVISVCVMVLRVVH
jgi:hypothetical protein